MLADHATATFRFVLPSLPVSLLIAMLLNRGVGLPSALAIHCGLTAALDQAMVWTLGQFGEKIWSAVRPFGIAQTALSQMITLLRTGHHLSRWLAHDPGEYPR
ncbi:MAG: hypothetical protein C0472_00800, partial [Erythrobacter sp.]|nr:hypothetical protein [Erythrobacter sp.]